MKSFIYKGKKFTDGDYVVCKIRGQDVNSARILIGANSINRTVIFIYQNLFNGMRPRRRRVEGILLIEDDPETGVGFADEYLYSWKAVVSDSGYINASVTDLTPACLKPRDVPLIENGE